MTRKDKNKAKNHDKILRFFLSVNFIFDTLVHVEVQWLISN